MVSGAEAHIPSASSSPRLCPLRFSALRTGGAGEHPCRALSPVSLASEKPGRRRQSPSRGKERPAASGLRKNRRPNPRASVPCLSLIRHLAPPSPEGRQTARRGRETGVLYGLMGPGDICGDAAACVRNRSSTRAGAAKGTLKRKRLLPSRFKVGKLTFSTRLFTAASVSPSLQRPPHRGCRGTPLPRSFPGFSRARETGPPEAIPIAGPAGERLAKG